MTSINYGVGIPCTWSLDVQHYGLQGDTGHQTSEIVPLTSDLALLSSDTCDTPTKPSNPPRTTA